MPKIPLPVAIVLAIVALVIVIWSVRATTASGGTHPPTGPPNAEAMQHMRESGMQAGGQATGRMMSPGSMQSAGPMQSGGAGPMKSGP